MKNSSIHKVHSHRRREPQKPLWKKLLFCLVVIVGICVAGAAAGFLFSVSGNLPDVSQTMRPAASSQIFDVNGKLITTVHAEENRLPVKLSETPQDLQNAFIAAEDIRFYEHHGIDPRGILRALYNNILSRDSTGQGGSTITQQLARNAFLTQEQTLKRKLLEAVLAIEIERKYTKPEILEMYMNQIYFGQGCYGVQTASHVYFNKDVKDLNLAQCALLAGLPNSPNYYSPFRSVEAAKYRQGIVLDQMAKYGFITTAQAEEAKKTDLELAKPSQQTETSEVGSYFVSYVVQTISDKYDSDSIYKEGLKVYTTLDLDMQKEAEEALKRQLPEGTKDANGLTQPQGALVALETKTGNIKAMVGGRGEDHFNRAVQMVRQPGSAFKPFTYVTALEKGYKPSDMLDNQKVDFSGWSPKNYDGTTTGPVSMTDALVNSLNIPTVNLANKVGMSSIIKTAKDCGITTLVDEGKYSDVNLAASIGGLSKGVSVIDMATAYSVFANDGKLVQPRAIIRVEDRNGNVLEDHSVPEDGKQVIDENAVYRLNEMLTQAVLRGTGGGAYIGRPMAGKTGTTDEEHDAWFIGYTPDMVCAVWIGDDTSSNAGYTGGTIPASIWKDFMEQALASTPAHDFNVPDSIRREIEQAQEQARQEAEAKKKQEEEEAKKKQESEAADQDQEAAREQGKDILDRVGGKVKGEP
jgi:penicillin-binding protein 1A